MRGSQRRLWNEFKCAQVRICAPFRIDASEATAPGYRHIHWRLLSRRFDRWSQWQFEMILRDEVQHTDISLVRDPRTDNLVEEEL